MLLLLFPLQFLTFAKKGTCNIDFSLSRLLFRSPFSGIKTVFLKYFIFLIIRKILIPVFV